MSRVRFDVRANCAEPPRHPTHALCPDGILVITIARGHVFCLQLHCGNQRITIADYEAPGTVPDEAEEAPSPDATPRTP